MTTISVLPKLGAAVFSFVCCKSYTQHVLHGPNSMVKLRLTHQWRLRSDRSTLRFCKERSGEALLTSPSLICRAEKLGWHDLPQFQFVLNNYKALSSASYDQQLPSYLASTSQAAFVLVSVYRHGTKSIDSKRQSSTVGIINPIAF